MSRMSTAEQECLGRLALSLIRFALILSSSLKVCILPTNKVVVQGHYLTDISQAHTSPAAPFPKQNTALPRAQSTTSAEEPITSEPAQRSSSKSPLSTPAPTSAPPPKAASKPSSTPRTTSATSREPSPPPPSSGSKMPSSPPSPCPRTSSLPRWASGPTSSACRSSP